MRKSKHTPGPWGTAEMPMDGRRRTVFSQTDEETAPAIAGGDTPERRDANARLIAAAPELLDLAEAVAAHFENTDAPLGEMARSAIARARGEV